MCRLLAVRHIPPSDTVSAGSRYSALHQVVGVVVVEFPVVDRRFVENRVEQCAGIHLVHAGGVRIQFVEAGTGGCTECSAHYYSSCYIL